MKEKSPAFPLYASDFYMDTVTWDTDDIGAYFRILMWSWVNGPLPNDCVKLAKIAGKTKQKFKKNWLNFSQKFSKTETGMLVNNRMEKERIKRLNYIEEQRKYGKDGAKKRWGTQ